METEELYSDLILKLEGLENQSFLQLEHERRTTPTRVAELCPFRESFLREFPPKEQEALRSYGACLLRLAATAEAPSATGETRLIDDVEGLFEEIRNLEQVCAFIADVSIERDSKDTEAVRLVAGTGALLGVLGYLLETSLQALK